MKAEPLNIQDKRFLVNRLIQQAPVTTLIREFFKNCDESASTAPLGKREVRIYPTNIGGIPKLTFWNTGIGMDDSELRLATDISSSINKEMSLNANFGIGAKVSGLTMSSEGIRYRSCKNGKVHEVTIGYDNEEGTYVRFSAELPDGSSETVYDITNTLLHKGCDLSNDWTEVVLLGESHEHNTVQEPMGLNKIKLDRSYVTTQIFRRFESFSEGVEVRIDVSMTKGGRKDETGRDRKLKTLNDVLDKLPKFETVTENSTGIAVRYIHDPKHEKHNHNLSSIANPATGSTAFCALVYKGERYDFKTGKTWSAAAPVFGVPFGSKILTIEILLPNGMALPNQYRDGLTWPSDRSSMLADDFADYVRELMPTWFKEIVKSQSPEADENLDDLQSDLQKLLDSFRIPTVTRSLSKNLDEDHTDFNDNGENSEEPTNLDGDEIGEDYSIEDKSNKKIQRALDKKIRKAPDGAQASKSSRALEIAPLITILTDPVEIEEKSLKGRAGCYYKDVQTLFVNGLYPVADRMALELGRELSGSADPELLRVCVLKATRYFMAYRVGKSVCYAISKRIMDDWTQDDLDRATSPESLTMAADDYTQSMSAAKRWSKKLIESEKLKNADAA
tara:strand:- start:1227 stop:3083 length:1857 start_codon:yes stop_codon:yes gene_type:complete